MKDKISVRVLEEANFMIKTNKTIREIAREFNISKSTVHKDLKDRLKKIDLTKYEQIKKIIKKHIETRHIKGGESTKKKYQKLSKKYIKKIPSML